jgi:hypothetical protein
MAAFAASTAVHSSLERHVRVVNREPVVASVRQIGFGGFIAAGALVAAVVSEGAFVSAKATLDVIANAKTINAFIVNNPSLLRQ